MIALDSYEKNFADDTSLFSFAHDKYVSLDELNSDLKKVIEFFNGKWNLTRSKLSKLRRFISQIELLKIVLFP